MVVSLFSVALAGAYYAAIPAQPATPERFVVRTMIWNCTDGTCVAPKAPSQDQVVCQLVARKLGVLSAFRANGIAMPAESLAKCNSAIK